MRKLTPRGSEAQSPRSDSTQAHYVQNQIKNNNNKNNKRGLEDVDANYVADAEVSDTIESSMKKIKLVTCRSLKCNKKNVFIINFLREVKQVHE